MKKILIIAITLLLSLSSYAQIKGYKLVEKSGQKPDWVSAASQRGFIIKQADQPSLEKVQTEAMMAVRAQMAESVANIVTSSGGMDKYYKEENGKTTNETTFKRSITSRVAKMPAIQGVSLTKAETYMEKYKDKKYGGERYLLWVKYPFSDADLQVLTDEYNRYNEEIDNKIKLYENGLNDINTVEQIGDAVTALSALTKEVDDIDSRYTRIQGMINRYLGIYNNITVDVVENTPGKLVLRLMYDGKVITSSQKPRISSNCADQFATKTVGDNMVVTYNKEYCYAQDDNYIEVRYRFGSKFVKEQVFFKLR